MKRIATVLMLIVFAAGLVLISNDVALAARRKDKEKEEVKEETKAEEPKLIYSFKSDEEMGEFEQLYIAKQATFGRMGVLQAYFALEQNNLTEIDKQMNEKFGFSMDPAKIYDLNRETKEIKEVGPIPAPPASAPME